MIPRHNLSGVINQIGRQQFSDKFIKNYTLHVCYTYKREKKFSVLLHVQSGSFDRYLYFSVFQSRCETCNFVFYAIVFLIFFFFTNLNPYDYIFQLQTDRSAFFDIELNYDLFTTRSFENVPYQQIKFKKIKLLFAIFFSKTCETRVCCSFFHFQSENG